jgi:hypothetical protein
LPGCERYNTLTDSWELIPPLPYDLTALTAFKFKERYIVAMGGMNYTLYYYGHDLFMTQMLVLDTFAENPDWEEVEIQGV